MPGCPVAQAVRIAQQVARALDGFHKLPVGPVYRDVKPSNILLTAAGEAKLGQRYSAAGANKILSAVRGVLRAAWQLGQMTAEDYHTAAAIKSIKGSQEEPAGHALAAGEILALLDTCLADLTPAGYRDAAVIALLYACGPRRAELVGLDLADVVITEDDGERWGKLTVRHGKGNKARSLPVAGGALTPCRTG